MSNSEIISLGASTRHAISEEPAGEFVERVTLLQLSNVAKQLLADDAAELVIQDVFVKLNEN